MKKIAIIPARAGSKGLPNKNILMLGDRPLMVYTIEAALKSNKLDRVIVSTDSLEYKYIAEKFGAEVLMRDPQLANDTASSFVVIEDVLKRIENVEYFVLLQVTSPFRNYNHINESIDLFEKNYSKYNFLVSMQKSDKPSSLIKKIGEDRSLKEYEVNFSNYARQQYEEYHPNGAIFIGKVKEYLLQKHFLGEKSLAYFMTKEDSIDIDDVLDFELAESIIKKRNENIYLKKCIKNQILKKYRLINKKIDILLIGDDIFARWAIKKFSKYSVTNMAISGINTKDYIELVFEKNKIENLPKYIFLMLGINDIKSSLAMPDIVKNINIIINKLIQIDNQIKIFFIEISSIYFRKEMRKEDIFLLNSFLKENLISSVKYIETNKYLTDEFGNLKLDYTNDGLNFNEIGYKQFEYALKKEINLE